MDTGNIGVAQVTPPLSKLYALLFFGGAFFTHYEHGVEIAYILQVQEICSYSTYSIF